MVKDAMLNDEKLDFVTGGANYETRMIADTLALKKVFSQKQLDSEKNIESNIGGFLKDNFNITVEFSANGNNLYYLGDDKSQFISQSGLISFLRKKL